MKGYLKHKGRLFQLAPKITTVGKEGCDLVVQSSSVDDQHALIEYREIENCFVLQDLHTDRGTYVNDCRVENASVRLTAGDVVRFGDSSALYELVTEREPQQSVIQQMSPLRQTTAWGPTHQTVTLLPTTTLEPHILYTGALPQLRTFNISTTQTYTPPQGDVGSRAGPIQLPRPPPNLRTRPTSAGSKGRQQQHHSERGPSFSKNGSSAGWIDMRQNGLIRSSSSSDISTLVEKEQREIRRHEEIRQMAALEVEVRRKDELIQLYADLSGVKQQQQHLQHQLDQQQLEHRHIQQQQVEHRHLQHQLNGDEVTSKLKALEREVLEKREQVDELKNKLRALSEREESVTYRADDRQEIDRLKAELESMKSVVQKVKRDKESAMGHCIQIQQQLEAARNNAGDASSESVELRQRLKAREREIAELRATVHEACEERYGEVVDELKKSEQERKNDSEILERLREELRQVQQLLQQNETDKQTDRERLEEKSSRLRELREKLKEFIDLDEDVDPTDVDLVQELRKVIQGHGTDIGELEDLRQKLEQNERLMEEFEEIKRSLTNTAEAIARDGLCMRHLKPEVSAVRSRSYEGRVGDLHLVHVRLLEVMERWMEEVEEGLGVCGVDIGPDGMSGALRDLADRLRSEDDKLDKLKAELQDIHQMELDELRDKLRAELSDSRQMELDRVREELEQDYNGRLAQAQREFEDRVKEREEEREGNQSVIVVELRQRVSDLETEIERLQEALDGKKKEESEERNAAREAMTELEAYRQLEVSLKSRIEELERGREERETRETRELEERDRERQRETEEYREQVKQQSATVCMLEEELNHLVHSNRDLKQENSGLRAALQEMERRDNVTHSADYQLLKRTLDQLSLDNTDYRKQLADQQNLVLALRRDLSGAQARLSDVTGELSEEQKREMEQYSITVKRQQQQLNEQQQQLSQLSSIVDKQAEELAVAKTEANKHKAAAIKFKTKLNEKEVELKSQPANSERGHHKIDSSRTNRSGGSSRRNKQGPSTPSATDDEKRLTSELSLVGAQCRGEQHEQVIARQREALAELRARLKLLEHGESAFLSKDEAVQQVMLLRQQLSDLQNSSPSLQSNVRASAMSGSKVWGSSHVGGDDRGWLGGADPIQMTSFKDLQEAFELSESQYLSLLKTMAVALELSDISGGLRSLAHCSREERERVREEREGARDQLSTHVQTLRERIARKDELLAGYERDLAVLRQVESATEITSNQAHSVMTDLRVKAEEVECLRESLRRLREQLDKERRINSAIKHKKGYSVDMSGDTNVSTASSRVGWPKHNCLTDDITQGPSRRRIPAASGSSSIALGGRRSGSQDRRVRGGSGREIEDVQTQIRAYPLINSQRSVLVD